MIVERVKALLSANAMVASMVGDRVFPEVLPQGCDMPAIAYSVVVDEGISSLDGYSDLDNAVVQVDCYSRSYMEGHHLADAVGSVMTRFISVDFSSLQVSRRDLYEDDTELHRVSIDYSVWERNAP